eukprot:6212254-Pleurochrysis_carterae.AAC.2
MDRSCSSNRLFTFIPRSNGVRCTGSPQIALSTYRCHSTPHHKARGTYSVCRISVAPSLAVPAAGQIAPRDPKS